MWKYLPATLGLAVILVGSTALAKPRSELEIASIKAASDCIAAAALNNPNITTLYRENRLKEATNWIVLQSKACANQLTAMRLLHEQLYGRGTGQAFLFGPYLDDLPRAVRERIHADVQNRIVLEAESEDSFGKAKPNTHVPSGQLSQPPIVAKTDPTDHVKSSETLTSLGLCSAGIADPLRYMLIDEFISGGKRRGNFTAKLKGEIDSDYGSFLTISDNATVEQVDKVTGKIGCKVTYELDLQGLAGKVLEEGATGRAEVLIRQMRQDGKLLRRRLEYTVQQTSGGWMVWLGFVQNQPARVQQRARVCLFAFGGQCAFWQ